MNRIKKKKPQCFTISVSELERHLSKQHLPPFIDYVGTFWNPETGETKDRVVQRDFLPWFVEICNRTGTTLPLAEQGENRLLPA